MSEHHALTGRAPACGPCNDAPAVTPQGAACSCLIACGHQDCTGREPTYLVPPVESTYGTSPKETTK